MDESKVDWRLIQERFARAQLALAPDAALTAEEAQRILRARARSLAQPISEPATAGPVLEALEFVLASEHYGFEARHVREVCPVRDLTPVPCTPAFVLGIISVRGQVVSVLDLKSFFDLPSRTLSDLDQAIILQAGEMEFAILADEVTGVTRVSLADLQEAPVSIAGIGAQYLRGVTPEGLILLDAARLLADPRVIVDEEVSA